MAFSIKQWLNKVGSGTVLDAPNTAAETHIEAASLRDLEGRLSSYTDAQVATVNGAGVVVTAAVDPTPSVVGRVEGTIWVRKP